MSAFPARVPLSLVPPGRWTVDPDASEVAFRVRHFGFASVEGRFTAFAGAIGPMGAAGSVELASIDTGNEVRDERLRSPDFFDAERFPHIAFETTAPIGAQVRGRLTIRDRTRVVSFEVEPARLGGEGPGLRARAVVSRKAFGLDWAGLREAERLIVSDRVELLLGLALLPAG